MPNAKFSKEREMDNIIYYTKAKMFKLSLANFSLSQKQKYADR